MPGKLAKFTAFANSLYPHELDYLIDIQQFDIEENIKILNLINYNAKNPKNTLPFDPTIDKRRYSYMKNWIEKRLDETDVDVYYDWLIKIEKKVMTDVILPDEEKELLQRAKLASVTHYYFIRFYELMKHYRDYLLIRQRNQSYEPVAEYLQRNSSQYKHVVTINEKLNAATVDIVKQHSGSLTESRQWEDFLISVFFDETIDGYTRYRGAVRLTYMYYNYREFEKLRSIYDNLDKCLKTDVFYSKRILANYYANRAMMHSKLSELEDAEKYGYLAIRYINNDYIFYLLNLCGVLLKEQKNKEALKIMQKSISELKNTGNHYYKIGFAAFYTRTLTANKMYDTAVDYAETFRQAYKKEIMKHRWHLFFSMYFQALSYAEKYNRILSLSKRYKLIAKEKEYIGKAKYLPILFWYYTIAEYMEGDIADKKLEDTIVKSGNMLIRNNYKLKKVKELLDELTFFAPGIFKHIKSKMKCPLNI